MSSDKIKELAERAGFHFYDMHDVDGQDLGETIEADSWSVAEKFAELIVRECIQVCKSRVANRDYNTGRMHCVSDIKEHFGIENERKD